MIIDKTIKFGYGTVLVHSSGMLKRLTLQHIQPPKPIGNLTEEDAKDIIVIEEVVFDYQDDMNDLLEALNSVTRTSPVIEGFRGYTFDFENYNEESVKILKRGLKTAIRGWQLALAC